MVYTFAHLSIRTAQAWMASRCVRLRYQIFAPSYSYFARPARGRSTRCLGIYLTMVTGLWSSLGSRNYFVLGTSPSSNPVPNNSETISDALGTQGQHTRSQRRCEELVTPFTANDVTKIRFYFLPVGCYRIIYTESKTSLPNLRLLCFPFS